MTDTTSNYADGDYRSVAENLIISEQPTEEAPQETETPEELAAEAQPAEVIIEDEEETQEQSETQFEPDEERLYTVKVDGKERQVSEQELTRGYSGQQYIQEQMRSLAEERKSVQSAIEAARQNEQRYAEAVEQYAQRLSTTDLQPPDKAMRKTDPIGYLEAMDDYREAMAERATVQQQQLEAQNRQAHEQQTQRQAYIQEQTQVVLEQIPGLKDPERAPQLLSAMMEAGKAYGFSEAEMRQESDPRIVKALHDLAQVKQRGNVDVAEVRRGAIKPGAKRSDVPTREKKANAARQAMKRSGRPEDVARFLLTGG